MAAGGFLAKLRALFRSESGELRSDRVTPPQADTSASGAGAVSIGGSADYATIKTEHYHFHSVEAERAAERLVGRPAPQDSLPADLGDFQGRGSEVERLKAILTKGGGQAAVSAIGGMGGVGKSALAVHVAHLLEAEAPDGRVFVDMAGTTGTPFAAVETKARGAPLTAIEAMVKVVAALEPEVQVPKEEDAARQAYRSVLEGKRVLLLLDNAENSAQVRPLLDWRAPTTMVVVTSRRTIAAPGLHVIDLDVMEPGDARALLRTVLGARTASDAELDLLAERCGALPLALRVAGTYLAQNPHVAFDSYLRALADEKRRLASLRSEEDTSLDVYAALALSARRLAEEKPQLEARWGLLAVFPASFDAAAAASVWEVEADAAAADLGELRRRSMVLWDEADDRWRLHDLMRDVAQVPLERQDGATLEARIESARARHARHYCKVLSEANRLYREGGNGVLQGLAQYDLEARNIQTGHSWAVANNGSSEAATRLCVEFPDAGGLVLGLRLHPLVWITWLNAQLDGSRMLGDRRREGYALGDLGNAWADLGEPRRAIEFYEQVLEIAREIGDRRAEGNVLGNLGIAWKNLGDPRRAIEFYEQHLTIAREIGDRRGEGSALGNLGLAWADLGERRRAIEFYEQVLEIMREIGDRRAEGNVLGNLGNAFAALGEPRRAIEYHEQALKISRGIGDRRAEGQDLGNLGNAFAALGEPRRAIELYEQHLAIAREIGDRRAEGSGLYNSGDEYWKLGERAEAVRRAREALAIFEAIGAKHLVERVRAKLAEWGAADGRS